MGLANGVSSHAKDSESFAASLLLCPRYKKGDTFLET